MGGDINIQLRKSSSNTSLSSLGSPSGAFNSNAKRDNTRHHNNSIKKGHLYFPLNTTTSSSSSSLDYQRQFNLAPSVPMESLLGPLDSGSASISEAEEMLRMNGGDSDKNGAVDNNEVKDSTKNGKEKKMIKEESPMNKVNNTKSRINFCISPRSEPMYVDDEKVDDNDVYALNTNNEGLHHETSIKTKTQQKQKNQQQQKTLLSDDLSETDSASEEREIIQSILSSTTTSSFVKQQKNRLSEEMKKSTTVTAKSPDDDDDDDDDDDGISYDTTSSQGKNENRSSVEGDEIKSPPQVQNYADILANVIESPEQVEENMDQSEDGNDSVTPKRRTSRVGAPIGRGEETSATEPNDEKKKNGGEDESIKPRAQRKRINSDGKRAPKHRRTKSGDDVAATLLTGSADWVGMELDKLPLPSQNEEDEDDEEDIENGMKGEEPSLEESKSFGNIRSEERANRRSRRKGGSEASLRQYKEKGGDAWTSVRREMPVEEFSKYAQSTEDAETGMKSASRFVPRVPKDDHYIPTFPNNLARHESIGNASVSSTGSQGTSTSAFSWISNRISLLSHKDEIERSDDMFGGLDNSVDREAIHFTPIPEEFQNNTVGQTIDIQEQQRKNAAAYDAHMMTLNHMQPYPLQPVLETDDCKRSFICPRCHTKQRDFFTVATVPKTFENPISFMVVYIVVYVILTLFVFGVEVSILIY